MPKKSEKASADIVVLEAPVVEPVLPGEAAVDGQLLDEAVAAINRIHTAKGLETARAIGNFVVETFFGGDLDRFGASEKGHATFRELARREDLQVSYTTIWYSVAVLGQLRRLPADLGEALPMTHHKLLLPLRDEKAKLRLAKRAVEQGLSTRDLAAEVAKVRARAADGRGRKPLPAFVKAISRLDKLAQSRDLLFGDLDKLDNMESAEIEELYQKVISVKAACEDLQARLQPRVPGFVAPEDE